MFRFFYRFFGWIRKCLFVCVGVDGEWNWIVDDASRNEIFNTNKEQSKNFSYLDWVDFDTTVSSSTRMGFWRASVENAAMTIRWVHLESSCHFQTRWWVAMAVHRWCVRGCCFHSASLGWSTRSQRIHRFPGSPIRDPAIHSAVVQRSSRAQPNRDSTGGTRDVDSKRAAAGHRSRRETEPRSVADDDSSTSTKQLPMATPCKECWSHRCGSSDTSRTDDCSKTP